MTGIVDEKGDARLPPWRSDEEIKAAIAGDPDEAPFRNAAELAVARERERRLDIYGVLRLSRSLGIGSPEVANRLRVPWARVRRWERGEEEPDPESQRKLDELARDPVLLARMEETRRLAAIRLAEMEREDPLGILALRSRLGLSQAGFAERYRIAHHTLQAWEEGRTEPDGAAKVLLAAIARDPEGVAQAARRAGDRAYLTGDAA